MARSTNEKQLCCARRADSEPTIGAVRDGADCPRDKKAKRDKFDLLDAVHLAEYSNVKRPIGRKSKQPIEPAHKLVVNLEADSSTKEK